MTRTYECDLCKDSKWQYDEVGRNSPCKCQSLLKLRGYLGELGGRDNSNRPRYPLISPEKCQLIRVLSGSAGNRCFLVTSPSEVAFKSHLKTALMHEFGLAVEKHRSPLTWKVVSTTEISEIRFDKILTMSDKKRMLNLPGLLIITAWAWSPYEHVYRELDILLADRAAAGNQTWLVTKDHLKLNSIKGVTPEFNFAIKEMTTERSVYIPPLETNPKATRQNPVLSTKASGPPGLPANQLDFDLETRIPEMELALVQHDSYSGDGQPTGK